MLHRQKYNLKFGPKDESELLLAGMNRQYLYYVIGVPKEIFKRYGKKIGIVVDNEFFTNDLIKGFGDKENFNIYQGKINLETIRGLVGKGPVICHIDNNYLGDYSHASHFVIIEEIIGDKVSIVDPVDGKRKTVSSKVLIDSIDSLRYHIKMCPLLYYLE